MKLTKKQYDSLDADLKKLFKPVVADGGKEEDATEFDNGEENASALKTARDRERDAAKALRDEKKALEDEKERLETELAEAMDAGKGTDKEALKKSYETKLASQKAKHTTEMEKLKGTLTKTFVTAKAEALAAEISTAPDLLIPVIERRLRLNLDGDEPATEILDASGKPSLLDFAELKQEFLGNPKYAAILVGSKGSGGGAGGGGNEGGAFDVKAYRNSDGSTNWSKVSEGMKSNPQLLEMVKKANTETPAVPEKSV